MKNILTTTLVAILSVTIGVGIGWFLFGDRSSVILPGPLVDTEEKKEYPLAAYTFEALRNKEYRPSTITIEKTLDENENFTSYLFSFSPLGRRMTGQLNVPATVTAETPVILMIRGYVPESIFTTGVGTRNGAAKFAEAGFITIAPDFFGYGESESEPNDSWQARFEKPIVVIELLETIRQNGVPLSNGSIHQTDQVGLWGHSNGGQIALSVLEITQEPLPTSLWAPVTAPFPYSVLFFSDEHEDEGKGLRIWLSQLEADYDLQQFSITQYLDGIRAPIQLHHGTADEAALKVWSDEFMQKIERENDRREYLREEYEESATESAKAEDPELQPIEIEYFVYPGTDHNLVPSWDTVVQRDIQFYSQYLGQPPTTTEGTALGELNNN